MAILMTTCGAHGAADADKTWLTDQSNCKVVEPGKHRGLIDKTTWDGPCVEGYISGKGTLRIGLISLVGEFKQGQLVGIGEMQVRDEKYRGEFQDNAPFGNGIWTVPEGTAKGVWNKDGQAVGPAILEWEDGSRYEGGMNESWDMHGKGRASHADGTNYEGDYLNGQRHGTGTWAFPSTGASYTGGYAFGKRDGHGVEVFDNGDRYVGGYKAGQRHGQGRYIEAKGAVREGEWKADELNGKCTIHESNSDIYEGTCLVGQRSGQSKLQMTALDAVYECAFKNDEFHGQGRLTAPGYVYEGAFALGMKSGRGKEVRDNGEQYEGEFARNQRAGHGILRGTDQAGNEVTYDGTFKDGAMEGPGTLTIGNMYFKGDFKQNQFMRGIIRTKQGKTIEADIEKGIYLEVLSNGTKAPLDPSALAVPEA